VPAEKKIAFIVRNYSRGVTTNVTLMTVAGQRILMRGKREENNDIKFIDPVLKRTAAFLKLLLGEARTKNGKRKKAITDEEV
jgi:hypothetical protein